jgi:hypothetical protein
MKTAVEFLIKEFSNILGKIQTEPLQDLFLIDAIKEAKEMEKQQIINAYKEGCFDNILDESTDKVRAKQYYKKTFKLEL